MSRRSEKGVLCSQQAFFTPKTMTNPKRVSFDHLDVFRKTAAESRNTLKFIQGSVAFDRDIAKLFFKSEIKTVSRIFFFSGKTHCVQKLYRDLLCTPNVLFLQKNLNDGHVGSKTTLKSCIVPRWTQRVCLGLPLRLQALNCLWFSVRHEPALSGF